MSSIKKVSSTIDNSILEPWQRPYRWLILAVLWLLYAAFGMGVSSIPPVVTPMLRDLNMSYSEMGFILGTWQLVFIPVAIFAGAAIDRWGIRRSLFAGGVIMALSVGLRYFATGFGTLLPIVALFGMGAPLISAGAPKAASEWFSGSNRAIAVGIYTTAPVMGLLVGLAATNSVVMPLTDYSWRFTFLSYSCLILVIAFIWGIFARDAGRGEDYTGAGLRESFVKLIKLHNVRIVVVSALIALFMQHGFAHWLPKILENSGHSPEVAGYMASVPHIAALLSVLLLPRLVKPRLRSRIIGMLGILLGTALLVVVTSSSYIVTVIGLLLQGAVGPALLPILILVIMEDPQVGAENMGLAGGLFFSVAQIGGFTGPLMMGVMVDATDAFLPGVAILAGMGIVVCVLTFFLKNTEA